MSTIVVNDGSPYPFELEEMQAPWSSRTTYIKPQGIAEARNHRISASQGELIALLYSDPIDISEIRSWLL